MQARGRVRHRAITRRASLMDTHRRGADAENAFFDADGRDLGATCCLAHAGGRLRGFFLGRGVALHVELPRTCRPTHAARSRGDMPSMGMPIEASAPVTRRSYPPAPCPPSVTSP